MLSRTSIMPARHLPTWTTFAMETTTVSKKGKDPRICGRSFMPEIQQ
ncbi:hypothetical protein M5D96_014242 [Drosophila gunungcola]|uniref:Uncharacterized protein n=1 Tax=Drosophila gunungcola TaxID=103775 RepID=A0A9Q0BIL7_9MUSC|nr:hypothetical protein M5D96_014242 [Drosophila gunungcola]